MCCGNAINAWCFPTRCQLYVKALIQPLLSRHLAVNSEVAADNTHQRRRHMSYEEDVQTIKSFPLLYNPIVEGSKGGKTQWNTD